MVTWADSGFWGGGGGGGGGVITIFTSGVGTGGLGEHCQLP